MRKSEKMSLFVLRMKCHLIFQTVGNGVDFAMLSTIQWKKLRQEKNKSFGTM